MSLKQTNEALLRRETWYVVRTRNGARYWSNHGDAWVYAQKVGGVVRPEQVLLVPGLSGRAWPLGAVINDETYFAPIEAHVS